MAENATAAGGGHEGIAGTAFMRTGNTSTIGKLTDPVGPFKVSADTKALLQQAAAKAGLTENEWVRDLVTVRLHGREHMINLYADRIDVVVGKGEESK